jgi:hypothetical protein
MRSDFHESTVNDMSFDRGHRINNRQAYNYSSGALARRHLYFGIVMMSHELRGALDEFFAGR